MNNSQNNLAQMLHCQNSVFASPFNSTPQRYSILNFNITLTSLSFFIKLIDILSFQHFFPYDKYYFFI